MKTILSVDGGGIRGIIPLACLVQLERREGRPANELFDMVAGTSTGSVIAAGLALGMSARGLLALYKDLARQAFQKLPWWKVIANLGNHRYSNAFIARTLDEIGGDRILNDLPVDILITAKNTRTSRTDFFVRDGPGNAGLWGSLQLKDAVLASIAAPTYFPAHSAQLDDRTFTWVDGGVGVAGNPSYHAAVEALHYTDGRYQPGQTRMLSFGTGRHPHAIDAQRASILQWARWSLDEILEDAGDWQTYVTRREYDLPGKIDLRRYQLDLAPDVMERIGVKVPAGVQVGSIGMDAVWAVDLLEAIGRCFADRIDFDDPSGLELETRMGW
ncbi:MAG: patatin-like phospholipase family protein [Anaerolineales bacterium]